MNFLAFYFLAKLYLYFRGYIGFRVLPNAAVLVAALAIGRRPSPRWRRILNAALCIAAFLVLWRDAYLPPLGASLGFMADSATRPTISYVFSFLAGYWNGFEVFVLAALFLACAWSGRHGLRLEFLAAALMFVPAVNTSRERAYSQKAASLESAFYSAESGRIVRFAAPPVRDRPFDVVIIHVCSLSWDDLRVVGLEKDPFFSEFDVLLMRFNTATSYSNPAAIRLLRAPCGQTSEGDLFTCDAPAGCYLMEDLKAAGFKPYSVFNHDGIYSHFKDEVVKWGRAAPPSNPGKLPIEEINFDGSPIYSNYAALAAWWAARQSSGEPRAALYYNTVSLHDGASAVADKSRASGGRVKKYRGFARTLFADLRRFFSMIESSGRDALVIFVPEHGAALEGSRIQAQGLRDIPLPSITTVPVGLRFISRGRRFPGQRRIDDRLSYLALADILAFSLRHRPDANHPFPALELAVLPRTPFMSENQFSRVLESENGFLLQRKDKTWSRLDPIAVQRPKPPP